MCEYDANCSDIIELVLEAAGVILNKQGMTTDVSNTYHAKWLDLLKKFNPSQSRDFKDLLGKHPIIRVCLKIKPFDWERRLATDVYKQSRAFLQA